MEIDLSEFSFNEKEERILKAAIEIFSEKGYSAATTSEISKMAGVAEGTVFNYFKTKKDILRRIMIHVVEIIATKMTDDFETDLSEQENGLYEMVQAFIRPKVIFVEEYFPIFRIVATEAFYHRDIRETLFQNVLPKILSVFELFFENVKKRYSLREETDTLSIMRIIGFQIYAIAIQHSIFKEMGAEFDLEVELDKTVKLIVYGIAIPESDIL